MLLVVAGATKLGRPSQLSGHRAGATGLLGFPVGSGVVRLVGPAEIGVGAFALLFGGPVSVAAVGCAYLGFALAVQRGRRAGADSCGCFGALDAPPSRIHVGVNLVLAAASLSAVATGTAGEAPVTVLAATFAEQPAEAAALSAAIMVLAGLSLVALTALPEALDARRPTPHAPGLFRALAVPSPSRRRHGGAGSAPGAKRDLALASTRHGGHRGPGLHDGASGSGGQR